MGPAIRNRRLVAIENTRAATPVSSAVLNSEAAQNIHGMIRASLTASAKEKSSATWGMTGPSLHNGVWGNRSHTNVVIAVGFLLFQNLRRRFDAAKASTAFNARIDEPFAPLKPDEQRKFSKPAKANSRSGWRARKLRSNATRY